MYHFDKKRVFSESLRWERSKRSYLDAYTQKRVSDKALYSMVRKRQEHYQQKMDKIANGFINSPIKLVAVWERKMASLIKQMHVDMTRFGRGGKDNTFAIHYLAVANRLRTVEYPALRNFAKQLRNGEISSKMFLNRSRYYVSSIRRSFEEARKSLYEDSDDEFEAKRLLGNCRNHCSDCLAYAMLGYQPLSSVILPTEKCQCKMNCCCSLRFRHITTVTI